MSFVAIACPTLRTVAETPEEILGFGCEGRGETAIPRLSIRGRVCPPPAGRRCAGRSRRDGRGRRRADGPDRQRLHRRPAPGHLY